MNYRVFPRTEWRVSEIGYGTWGMAGWTGSNDAESIEAMERALALGCNFFDTAFAYGQGHSERLLGRLLRGRRGERVFVATKVPPKNGRFPARAEYPLDEVFPVEHIREMTMRSLDNLGLDRVDLQQLHVWTDAWAEDERWQRAVEDLKREGLIRAFGLSLNRWDPASAAKALRTGLVDCVQVVYNVFDQNPEDELFPLCRELGVAVIARVPFDEGSLTGAITPGTTFPDGDWRKTYFKAENLQATLERAERLKAVVPAGMTLPELALRFILSNPDVTTTIPGMRRARHVEANLAASDGRRLPDALLDELRQHRWVRTPTA